MSDTPPTVKITERLTSIDTYKKLSVYVIIIIIAGLLVGVDDEDDEIPALKRRYDSSHTLDDPLMIIAMKL